MKWRRCRLFDLTTLILTNMVISIDQFVNWSRRLLVVYEALHNFECKTSWLLSFIHSDNSAYTLHTTLRKKYVQ